MRLRNTNVNTDVLFLLTVLAMILMAINQVVR